MKVSPSNERVGEGQLVGLALDEPDASGTRRRATASISGALVEADDRAARLPDELGRDGARAGRDVEHRLLRPDLDAGDEEPAPARVLAEGEEPRVAVVGRPERREERPCALRSVCGGRH